MVKPIYGQPISGITYKDIISILEDNLKILHPFVPFISEEIWQHITKRTKEEALIISSWPKLEEYDEKIIKEFDFTTDVISGIRTIRKEKNISFKETINLSIINNLKVSTSFDAVIKKLGNIESLAYINKKLDEALTYRVKANEYFIPIEGAINVEDEIAKLTEELKYTQGFLKSIRGKLKNERFVNNAPEKVVAIERQKEADALAKIATLKRSLEGLM